jgi:hypothetical protein
MKQKINFEEIKEKMDQIVYNKSKDFLNTFEKNIEGIIKQSIFSLLGISSTSYDTRGYEIDHCNGRNSILSDVIKNKAMSDVEKFVKNIKIESFTITQLKEAFKKEYDRQIKDQIEYSAKHLAEQHVNDYIKKLTKKYEDKLGISKTNLD